MKSLVGIADRPPAIAAAACIGALGLLTATLFTAAPVKMVAPALAVAALAIVGYRWILRWPALLVTLALVILLIPIRRYVMPGDLPFELEPYRLLVAFIAAGWIGSLLVDPRIRLRRSGFEGPLLLFGIAAVGSILANPGRLAMTSADVLKEVTFGISFLLTFYLIVSVVSSLAHAELIVKVLVGGGSIVAASAVIESRTGYNVFDDLAKVIPYLRLDDAPDVAPRGARLRVYASAQHPIALGAMLVMLVPFAVYLARTASRRWWIVGAVLVLGALGTVSRTSVLMLMVVGLVFLWLRPLETRRLWPAVIPVLVVVHLALPGTIGTLKASFFPEGGLIAQQQQGAGTHGSGRVADLGPALDEYSRTPLLGQGYGTRIVEHGEGKNANILDNQWLGTLLETGAIGFFAWAWLFVRAIRRFGGVSRRERTSEQGWLFVAITAAIAAFAVSMFTYDAFSFIQVTFLLFITLALGSVLSILTKQESAKLVLR